MDYVVGSVAALISGNVTPNRPKFIRRALTPTKHQPSPNVTPKSELVEDRSIFLSPTLQKKKAIVKKSPKRIFENPDLDATENSEGNSTLKSPKAEKVKKHLKDELENYKENHNMKKSQKTTKSIKDSVDSSSSNIENMDTNIVENNENTPKKKKKRQSLSETVGSAAAEANDPTLENQSILDPVKIKKSPKLKERRKSVAEQSETMLIDQPEVMSSQEESAKSKKRKIDIENSGTSQKETNTDNMSKSQKKRLKRKLKAQMQKNNKGNSSIDNDNKLANNKTENTETQSNKKLNNPDNSESTKTNNENQNQDKSPKKKKNKSKNNQKPDTESQIDDQDIKINNEVEIPVDNIKKSKKKNKNAEIIETNLQEISNLNIKSTNSSSELIDEDKVTKKHKKKQIVNPNAITNKDTDSEHESDDEIESENEEINKKALEADITDKSSDEEEEEPIKEKKLENVEPKEHKMDADEIKRTLFVGNVPFSAKCKKQIKKIFNKYGRILTVRIRTVPVKDARVTPKLAVIKNELHPERTTVNMYIKYADIESVEKALVENNALLEDHHLRVTRSDHTGAEHDPRLAVFVGNLPFAIEDDTLRAKFEKCGEIESVRIIRDKKTNAGKGFGYVNFASKDGVELALALTEEDLTIKNRILRVKRCTQVTQNQSQRRGVHSKWGPKQEGEGAVRRLMHKRKHQDGNGEGPPNKRPNYLNQPSKEKKPRKEFVGMTAEKKKKRKFDKGQKKKKVLSKILTNKS